VKIEIMITKTCGYAIRGVIFLALENNINRKIGIKEIAEELAVPQQFMGKILQDLVRKDILKSTKGPNGGFYVDDSILSLSLIRIVEAIDGLGVLKKCFLGRDECSSENPCPMHEDFELCRNNIFEIFQNKNIQHFVEDIEAGATFLATIK
jgi:Rrf2 family transcriptional regulator, iron-sulfur cluster assembly transcription factor